MITVKDLPESDRTSTQRPDGSVLYGLPVFLYCDACGGEYSATRGDYFWAPRDEPLTCACGVPLRLVRRATRLVGVRA